MTNRLRPCVWAVLRRALDTRGRLVKRRGDVVEQQEEPSHHEQGDDRNHERVLDRGHAVFTRPQLRELGADVVGRRAQQEHSSAPPFPPQGPAGGAAAQRHVPLVLTAPAALGEPVQLRACLANALQGNLVAQGAHAHRVWCRSDLRRITHPILPTQHLTVLSYACWAQSASSSKRSWTALNSATTPEMSRSAMMVAIRAYSTEVTPRSRQRGSRILNLSYSERARPLAGCAATTVRRRSIRDDGSSCSSGSSPGRAPPAPSSNRPWAECLPGRLESTSDSRASTSLAGRRPRPASCRSTAMASRSDRAGRWGRGRVRAAQVSTTPSNWAPKGTWRPRRPRG